MATPKAQPVITGVGSALVDMLLRESQEFLADSGAIAGGMKLVDRAEIDSIVAKTAQIPVDVPGGSACNTIVGAGRLGARARFIGKRGTDPMGEELEQSLRQSNVEPILFTSATGTGRVLSIVTPDAQRSMCTFLGASAEMTPADIKPAQFAGSDIVHLEGYLLFNRDLMYAALKAAKASGALVSLDLASHTVVDAARETLHDIVGSLVDIVIANEDEARAYTGESDEHKALAVLAAQAPVAVVKLGKRGSLICRNGETSVIAPIGEKRPVDTTGAGDLWAAGFLYGIACGYDNQAAGQLASICGYEVTQVMGAQIPADGWERIREYLVG